MKTITLLVITDGRLEYLKRTILSADENLKTANGDGDALKHRILIDDSTNPEFQAEIDRLFGDRFTIIHHSTRRGFAGAIQSGWAALPEDTEYVFHLEDDFVFNTPIYCGDMQTVLENEPLIAQIALRRQAWGHEVAFGGFVEQWPNLYTDKEGYGSRWFEHRNFFTTNPSLYPIRITKYGWPDAPDSEGKIGPKLWADGYRCAFWGSKSEPPKVHHIGDVRAGTGY